VLPRRLLSIRVLHATRPTATHSTFSMPPRPFPHAFRVGTDICNVPRVQRLLVREHKGRLFLHRFLHRVLTEPERNYFWERFGPPDSIRSRIDDASQYLAGRHVVPLLLKGIADINQGSQQRKPCAKHATIFKTPLEAFKV
jgi:hypothetical protein